MVIIFVAKNWRTGKSSKSVKTSISMMPHITNLTPFQNGSLQRQVRVPSLFWVLSADARHLIIPSEDWARYVDYIHGREIT